MSLWSSRSRASKNGPYFVSTSDSRFIIFLPALLINQLFEPEVNHGQAAFTRIDIEFIYAANQAPQYVRINRDVTHSSSCCGFQR